MSMEKQGVINEQNTRPEPQGKKNLERHLTKWAADTVSCVKFIKQDQERLVSRLKDEKAGRWAINAMTFPLVTILGNSMVET